MSRILVPFSAVLLALGAAVSVSSVQAQTSGSAPAPAGPGGTWSAAPAAVISGGLEQTPKGGESPVTAASLANPDLELTLIVPAGQMMLTGNPGDDNNPTHVWTGLCTTPCGLALRSQQHLADLSGLARIRWTTKTSGYHQLRALVKLADGTWLVGDRAVDSPRDWTVSEISFTDLHWLKFDIARAVTTGAAVEHVDLSRVDQIGFIDLMPASGHGPGGWSDLAQIEVYGKPVPR